MQLHIEVNVNTKQSEIQLHGKFCTFAIWCNVICSDKMEEYQANNNLAIKLYPAFKINDSSSSVVQK